MHPSPTQEACLYFSFEIIKLVCVCDDRKREIATYEQTKLSEELQVSQSVNELKLNNGKEVTVGFEYDVISTQSSK